jgi:hypothetical protein
VKLTADKPAQLAPVCIKGGRGNEGGINAAVRDLGIDRSEAQFDNVILNRGELRPQPIGVRIGKHPSGRGR